MKKILTRSVSYLCKSVSPFHHAVFRALRTVGPLSAGNTNEYSFIFTMLYKIDGNMRNYAIRMVVGETYGGIAFRYIFESFAVFLLGQITGFFAFKIYAVNSYIYIRATIISKFPL